MWPLGALISVVLSDILASK